MTEPPPQSPMLGTPAASSSILGTPVSSEPLIPTAERDLRETFDLPLMMAGDAAPAKGQRADAAILFQDDAPAQPRRRTGAEARSRARKCPECGTTVAVGMSLCNFCGLDLDTGTRIDVQEEMFSAPPPMRAPTLPIGVGVVGGLTGVGSAALLLLSLLKLVNQKDDLAYWGYACLGVICAFGIYGSVQFLRGKSIKLLLIALTLGAITDIIGLIAIPVYMANESAASATSLVVDPEAETPSSVQPVVEFNWNTLYWGIALLLVYGGVVFYLLTPGVRRYFERQTTVFTPGVPMRL
jgi:hypothetical protein